MRTAGGSSSATSGGRNISGVGQLTVGNIGESTLETRSSKAANVLVAYNSNKNDTISSSRAFQALASSVHSQRERSGVTHI